MTNRAPSLIDQLQIRQEPRGQIGRVLLACERALANLGLTARLHPISQLVTVYERHAVSWNGLTPILDTRYAPIAAADSSCMSLYDQRGETVAVLGCRYLDLGDRSVADACEDLTLFYGADAPKYVGGHRCVMTAPSAKRLKGELVYHGALWIRPDQRRSGACTILREASRCYMASQWNFSHEFSVGASPFHSQALQKDYAYTLAEPSVAFFVDDHPIMTDGLLLGLSRAEIVSRFDGVLHALSKAADAFDRDQERAATG
jgi:hypothetical protein